MSMETIQLYKMMGGGGIHQACTLAKPQASLSWNKMGEDGTFLERERSTKKGKLPLWSNNSTTTVGVRVPSPVSIPVPTIVPILLSLRHLRKRASNQVSSPIMALVTDEAGGGGKAPSTLHPAAPAHTR